MTILDAAFSIRARATFFRAWMYPRRITAELPGLEKKDVQIDFADDMLTIKGEKKFEKEEREKNRRVMERRYGSFFRTIQLPSGIDPAKIEASIANATKKIEIKPRADHKSACIAF